MPFAETPFRPQPGQQEALARMHYAVDHRWRLVLLFGPPGCGKTVVQRGFVGEVRQQGKPVAFVSLLGSAPSEVAWSILADWGRNPPPSLELSHTWRELSDQLTEFRYQQQTAVLVGDDADMATPETSLFIQRLLATESPPTMILALDWLSRSRLPRRILEQADMRIDLEPWSPEETAKALLPTQGNELVTPFTAGAVTRVHDLADGLPRKILQLAELARIAASGQSLACIEPETVEQVRHELSVR